MSQRIVLNLGRGNFDQGCPFVTAQLWSDSQVDSPAMPMQFSGSLPPAPNLEDLYPCWQRLYEALYAHKNWRQTRDSPKPLIRSDVNGQKDTDSHKGRSGNWRDASGTDSGTHSSIDIVDDDITHISTAEFDQFCTKLQHQINVWLNAEGFRAIDRGLRTHLSPQHEIHLIIMAENHQILRLPWSLWSFLEDFPRAEVALSSPAYRRSDKQAATPYDRVKILAVLGDRSGIDVDYDRQLLEQIPDSELRLLVEPGMEDLNDQLWDWGCDILFFAGHSASDASSSESGQERGRIQLNPSTSLTLGQLKFGLKRAIARGLKLAIFNSCDGLGLAWDLADLNLPQVIVMREPVPDRVAQAFLKSFLNAFSSGESLYLSVREAREKLQGLEAEFPCASWLPTVCQNPAEIPPRWNDWCTSTDTSPSSSLGEPIVAPSPATPSTVAPSAPLPSAPLPLVAPDSTPSSSPTPSLARLWPLLMPLVVTGLVLGVRSLGILQLPELWAFDRLLALRPAERPDSRLLIVTINELEIQAQDPDERRGALSDAALKQALDQLLPHQPRAVGIDIYRDFPTRPQYPDLQDTLRDEPRIIAICKGRDAIHDEAGVAPPPDIPPVRVGFSDFLEDADGILRRHLLSMTPDPTSPCTTPYAFSTMLAFLYLAGEGATVNFTPEGNLQLDDTVLERLQANTGGYRGIDAQGNQIMLNYRALRPVDAIAPTVSLTQLLEGTVNPDAIQDRIVIIGVTAASSQDLWITPYGSGTAEKVSGVFVQAQMVSQLLSAVLDQRPMISSWSWIGNSFWILGWAIAGSLCILVYRGNTQQPRRVFVLQAGTLAIALLLLIGSSVLLLVQGVWVPLLPAGIACVSTGMAIVLIKPSKF